MQLMASPRPEQKKHQPSKRNAVLYDTTTALMDEIVANAVPVSPVEMFVYRASEKL
jgi:hypothetical protein